MKGWPETRLELNTKIQDFWNFRHELSVYYDIIFKGERVVIPLSMRPEMLEKVHESHLGIEKSRSRARDIMFWPMMSQDIENLISNMQYAKKVETEIRRSHCISMRYRHAHGQNLQQTYFSLKMSSTC